MNEASSSSGTAVSLPTSLIIITFHGVGPIKRELDAGESSCWLDYSTLEAVLDLVKGQQHVRLTVDDGNASDYELILPALRRRGLNATFFVCSSRVDAPTFLTQTQLSELLSEGMAIGSHGADHCSWRKLSSSEIEPQLRGSRVALEKISGGPILSAACPFGAYDCRVLSNLRQAGYSHVYTSDGGRSTESQWIRARTTVTRSTSLKDIQQLIQEGPSAWTQSLVDLRKLAKRIRP